MLLSNTIDAPWTGLADTGWGRRMQDVCKGCGTTFRSTFLP